MSPALATAATAAKVSPRAVSTGDRRFMWRPLKDSTVETTRTRQAILAKLAVPT